MNTKHAIGFLVALCLIAAMGGAFLVHFDPRHALKLALEASTLFTFLGGAVVVNYLYPASPVPGFTALPPTTTVPTQAQMGLAVAAKINTVVATVTSTTNSDTGVALTHDFQLPNSDITNGFPTVIIDPITALGATQQWIAASQNPNFTWLTKVQVVAGAQDASTLGLNGVLVTIRRPHSIDR
jgi:hypothetical protein